MGSIKKNMWAHPESAYASRGRAMRSYVTVAAGHALRLLSHIRFYPLRLYSAEAEVLIYIYFIEQIISAFFSLRPLRLFFSLRPLRLFLLCALCGFLFSVFSAVTFLCDLCG